MRNKMYNSESRIYKASVANFFTKFGDFWNLLVKKHSDKPGDFFCTNVSDRTVFDMAVQLMSQLLFQ